MEQLSLPNNLKQTHNMLAIFLVASQNLCGHGDLCEDM